MLDEPTSAIDSKTESVILDALDRLMVGRTSFMIAHRLSTVHRADLILVMDQGRIVQRGTHDELVAVEGLYRQLHEIQNRQSRRRAVSEKGLEQSGATFVRTFVPRPSGRACGPPALRIHSALKPIFWRTASGNASNMRLCSRSKVSMRLKRS